MPRAARSQPILMHAAAKPILFALALVPFSWLLYGAFADTLGTNPAEKLMRATGDWTLRFICITLAITPLRHWAGRPALARFRRMSGLFAFFYACVHFLCYAWLDMGFDAVAIVRDIPKRPFILVGSLALVLLIPLAATSFNRAMKALGAARWQLLHRLVYVVAPLGLLHFFWMRAAKNDFAEVSAYAAIVAVLLGWRALARWARRRRSARSTIARTDPAERDQAENQADVPAGRISKTSTP
ncbi:MAG: protein-methionine-sulfoxide reductase heme-binding subunit MsrQ [Burkholderiaceae bacterium]